MKQKYWRFKNLKIDRGLHTKGCPWVISSFHYLDSKTKLTTLVETMKNQTKTLSKKLLTPATSNKFKMYY